MVDSKNKARKGTGKVAFQAHLEGEKGIRKMIEAGYTTIMIFEAFEKKMPIKQQQFGKYVRELKQLMKGEVKNEPKPKQVKAAPIRTREPGQPAFVSSDTPRDNLIKPKE